jgi:spermidine synthase
MRIPLAILGLTELIGPVTLMREFMAVSGNNTQGPMVILAASWLWMAVGAWLAEYRGRGIVFGRETADTWSRPYAATLVLVALFLPLQIVLARATPQDWLEAWSGIGLGVLLSAPLNLMLGAQYALGRRLLEIQEGVPGRAFIFQATGAAVGGLLLASLLLPLFNAIQIALLVAALNLTAGWWMGHFSDLILVTGIANPFFAYVLMFFALSLSTLALPLGATLKESTLARQWPGLIAEADSSQGRTIIVKADGETQVYWSGVPCFKMSDEQSRTLIRWALTTYPHSRHLMLVGGGPTGLQAALTKPLETISYAEPDLALTRLWQDNLPPKTTGILTNHRLTLASTDARSYLMDSGPRYDLLVVNLPGPVSESLNRYYTVEFWALARQALAPNGWMVVRLPNFENSDCAASVRAALMETFASVEEVRVHTDQGPLILVGTTEEPAKAADNLPHRGNCDLWPMCPISKALLHPLSVADWGSWVTKYGWLATPVGLLFLLGLARRDLKLFLLPAFVALAGGATLAGAIIGLQRSLGLVYSGAAELFMAYAAGVAIGGAIAWPLTGLLKQRHLILSVAVALMAQSALVLVEPGLIRLLAGRPLLPWVMVALMTLGGLPTGVALSVAGSQGRPGAAFVAALAGGAMGITLAGLLIVPSADMAVGGQIMAALSWLGLAWLIRI